MLDTLASVFNDGGRLVGVSCALFVGAPSDHPFVTAIALRFEHLTAVFRAVPADDTLAASLGPLPLEADEEVVDLDGEPPWSSCLGLGICWGWRLTNQQGYTDGVRLEFSAPGEASPAIVELVAIASGIQVFEARRHRHAESGAAPDQAAKPGPAGELSRPAMELLHVDQGDEFLRAIVARPDDTALRAVYADWLEERGDIRAEFLRCADELMRLPYEDSRRAPLRANLEQLRPNIDPAWRAYVELRLPADLVEFFAAGKQLEYDAEDSDASTLTLVPLSELRLERFPVETGALPVYEQDPHYPDVKSYLVLGVNLVASCSGDYEGAGWFIWFPVERRYGMWDSSHCGIRLFGSEVTWEQIAADPVEYIEAMWAQPGYGPPVEDLVPWPAHPYHTCQVYDRQPA